MKRVNQMNIYRLGASLRRLAELRADLSPEEFKYQTDVIAIRLRAMSLTDFKQMAPAATERAQHIWKRLTEIFAEERAANIVDVTLIQDQYGAFETSLEDDLSRLPTYVIERVGAYSSDQLIASADNAFPPSLKMAGLIPQTVVEDFRKAGACLAFDLPTACGFHAFRAADAMIRHYYAHFVHIVPKKKPRDWGAYIRVFRSVLNDPTAPRKPNIRTIELLDSIRSVDRNPVIHPELDLDADAALAAFDLCKNVIVLMAADIKAAP